MMPRLYVLTMLTIVLILALMVLAGVNKANATPHPFQAALPPVSKQNPDQIWVLILVVRAQRASSMMSQEFDSESSCKQTSEQVLNEFPKGSIFAWCVPK